MKMKIKFTIQIFIFLCLWFVLFYYFLVLLIVRGNSKGPTIKNFEGGVGKEERLGDLA